MLERADTLFRVRCIDGLVADAERCAELFDASHASVTALVPVLGYERAAEVAKTALRERRSIRKVVLERGLLTEEVLDRLFSAEAMTALGYVSQTQRNRGI